LAYFLLIKREIEVHLVKHRLNQISKIINDKIFYVMDNISDEWPRESNDVEE
jgi:hypothetical protein